MTIQKFALTLILSSLIFLGKAQIERSTRHILADFKGGKAEFKQWLSLEMQYPTLALKTKQKGKAVFVVEVDENGTGKIIRRNFSAGVLLDQEAIRLIKMIDWVPAMFDGKPIKSTRSVAIHFSPNQYQHFVQVRGYDTIQLPKLPVDTSFVIYNLEQVSQKPKPILPENKKFDEYIYSNLKFPPQAYKLNISGVTKLTFVVEPSGIVTNIYPEKYLGGGCFEEAVRVIRMLKWEPAQLNGMLVRSYFECTIAFNIENNPNHLNPIGTNNSMH